MDALEEQADEGRRSRRKRRGADKQVLIRRYPNEETHSDVNRSTVRSTGKFRFRYLEDGYP